MTNLILFCLALFGSRYSAVNNEITPVYHVVQVISTDLNHDGRPDTVLLLSSIKNKGSFNRVSVRINGHSSVFNAKDVWTKVDSWFASKNKNDVKSDHLFISHTSSHAAILLFGVIDGAGYREEFSIINIENDDAKMVFDDEEKIDVEVPQKITDLDGDGRLEFIFNGMSEIAQELPKQNADVVSYTPYFVYTIDRSCFLNRPLTKKYNQEHYIFAGFKYNENILILRPRNSNKKPSIWKH